MKRYLELFFFLLFLLSAPISFSQPYAGVFGGINNSKLSGNAPQKASYKGLIGIEAGAHLDLKIGKSVWISIQPSYSQQGTRISYKVWNKYGAVDSIRIRLNYFSVPVLLKVSFINQRFYAIGGIETAYLLDNSVTSHDEKQDIDLKISEWNVAILFGIGIHIPLGFPRLFAELRYAQGIINLTDEPISASYIPRVKTTGFRVLTGIEIPLKRMKD
jgi:hypothetical protein